MFRCLSKAINMLKNKEITFKELVYLFLTVIVLGRILSPAYFAVINFMEKSSIFIYMFRKSQVDRINKLFYLLRSNTFDTVKFMGKHILKFPTDLWIYQEIIFKHKPDVIVETGVFLGGSTFYLSKLLEMIGGGRVIAVDIVLENADPDLYELPNVTLLEGSSTDPEIFSQIKSMIKPDEKVMVILDSDHATAHVYSEMMMYSEIVTDNQYMIVEDGLIEKTYPILMKSGPVKAIKKFLKNNCDFVTDYYQNRFLLSQNPKGYLLKTKNNDKVKFTTEKECYRSVGLWLPGQDYPKNVAWKKYLNQNKADSV